MRCPRCGRCSECGQPTETSPYHEPSPRPVWPPPGEPLRTIPIPPGVPYVPGYGETATPLPRHPITIT
jgi:hypothetical protein